ncbi:MAG: hypothetical protein M0Z76_03215 [Gammaproteobacteria bacterium]|nr:hypothetical protein [Gammaproteobacteria bacterium]
MRLHGRFSNVLTWDQLAALWSVVRSRAEGWYIYAIGEAPPNEPATPAVLDRFVLEMDVLLRREHREDYCGIVYADDRSEPTFIKIFDPHNLGSSCGSSGAITLPGWLLTRMPPEPLQDTRLLPESRKRWWRSLIGR